MARIVQFLSPSDILDICCPSTSRSTIVEEDTKELEQDFLLESPFVLIPPQQKFGAEKQFAELKDEDSTKALMEQLTQVREDLKKVPTLSTKDKSQINSMLLLLRGEVSNKKNSHGRKKKLNLSKFRSGKGSKKVADV
jgi:hypothetical protein